MSESGSSFEKIEFEQSALSAPSTGESSDLTSSDQNSIDESWATTMSGSTEDQTKSMQLEDLEFELGWKTRDEIMCTLSEHTTLLSGLIIQEDAREKVRKTNADLIVKLLNLPLKVDGRWRSIESPECSLDDAPNELLFDLSSEVRSRIVDTLIINHNIALEANRVSDECKAKLIDRNSSQICELVQLRFRTVYKGDHRIEQASKTRELQTSVQGRKRKLDEPLNSFALDPSGSETNKRCEVDYLYAGTYRYLSRTFIRISDEGLFLNLFSTKSSVKIDFKLIRCLRYCYAKIDSSKRVYILVEFLQEAVEAINEYIGHNPDDDDSFRFESINGHEEVFVMKLKYLPSTEVNELQNLLQMYLPNQFKNDLTVPKIFEEQRQYVLTLRSRTTTARFRRPSQFFMSLWRPTV